MESTEWVRPIKELNGNVQLGQLIALKMENWSSDRQIEWSTDWPISWWLGRPLGDGSAFLMEDIERKEETVCVTLDGVFEKIWVAVYARTVKSELESKEKV